MKIECPRFILLVALAIVLSASTAACSSAPEPADGGSDASSEVDASELDAGGLDGGELDASEPDAGEPDAGEPPCDPGATRTAACGACGDEAQACGEDGMWAATSGCLGQGECVEGSVETRDGELCAQEQRICLAGCAWSDWEPSRGPGVCEPGATRRVADATCSDAERVLETCDAACAWVAGPCVDACGGAPARTSPEWAREVCVPSGDFMRGMDGVDFYTPAVPIYVSSFYIDVYPVTYRRYQQCVTAGACAVPTGTYARTDAAFLDYPVQGISRNAAADFCAWDGGRRFVSAAEWQKAARGPAPRTNVYPWGDVLDCSIVNAGVAPCSSGAANSVLAQDPYDAFSPAAASYYGVQLMGFGTTEWVLDRSCGAEWHTLPESRVPDPVCESPGTGSIVVSGGRYQPSPVYWQLHSPFSDTSVLWSSIRCGRSGLI